MKTNSASMGKSLGFLFLLVLVIGGLYFSRDFLVPVTLAGLISMLFIPLADKLENKGCNRAVSSLTCIIILLLIFGLIASLLSWQASNLSQDISQIQQELVKIVNQIRQFISESFGLSVEEQKKLIEKQTSKSIGAAGSAGTILATIMSFLVTTILVLVYIFLLLFFRDHLKKFLLMLIPLEEKKETEKIINEGSKVAQQYLIGLGSMILILWILYGIGFSIVGVKSAIFFAILCGILEIIPFIGNLTGTILTVFMVIAQGGNGKMILGVIIVYSVIQFVQTYILEPFIVGAEVNINPLFTILIIVAMEMIWGIPGMVLAIPMLGIFKIICDHVDSLKPYGFLIGQEKKAKKENKLVSKFKNHLNKK